MGAAADKIDGTLFGEPTEPTTRGRGRPRSLDPVKRRKIVELLSQGCTCLSAARAVGCSRRTIARTARRDLRFAAEVLGAKQAAKASFLGGIRRMARTPGERAAVIHLLKTFADALGEHRT